VVNVSDQRSDLIPLLFVGEGLSENVGTHVVSGTRVDNNMLVLFRLMEKRKVHPVGVSHMMHSLAFASGDDADRGFVALH